jgi:hypothetical protein
MTQPEGNQTQGIMTSKTSILPLILAALFGGSVVFLLSQLQFRVWVDDSNSRDTTPPVIDIDIDLTPKSTVSPQAIASPGAKPRPPKTVPNGLRVSNQSPTAARVVLLSQKNTLAKQKPYRSPAHWDFAPNEGSQGGLLLSLPEGTLKLASGDVLVAFALDGSRQYWGPYVVGKTSMPNKVSKSSEWQLQLRP